MKNVQDASMRRERGIALAVALILLVVLTLLALSGIRMSTMELRMSLNDEFRITAFEQAQSLVDAAIRDFNNTPVLARNRVFCARAATGCTDNTAVKVPDYSDELTAGTANVVVRRVEPQNAEPPVGTGFSLTAFDAAYMQVSGQYTANTLGRGEARVNEGVAVVYGQTGDVTTDSDPSAL
jgi:Tfp pilus assembly protein PilX